MELDLLKTGLVPSIFYEQTLLNLYIQVIRVMAQVVENQINPYLTAVCYDCQIATKLHENAWI